MQSPRFAPAPGTPRQDLLQSPDSASSLMPAANVTIPCDAHLDLHAPPRRRAFPCRPTSSDTGT
eukprot:1807217-Pyramimonas_sp.AAC.1